MEGFVKTEIINSVGVVSFYHPKGNSLPSNLLSDLQKAIENLSADDSAKVILLRSEGTGAFCAGASFDELLRLEDFDSAKNFFAGFGCVINAIRKSPKFVIGRVQGKVVGGGLGLVSACDYVVAVKTASVRLSEFSIAIGPFVISCAVERKIGKSAFTQMTIDTEWYDAEWCLSKGLFNKVFDSVEEMDKFLDGFLQTLVGRSSKTQQELKKLFWRDTTNWDAMFDELAETVARLALSPETKEIIKNLAKK